MGDAALPALLAWLTAGGATFPALAVGEVAGRRGVVAARAIAAGEVVATVPRALLVTREHVRASSVGRQIRDAGLELTSPHAWFAAWLCVEARRGGAHAPYLAALPAGFDEFPVFATDAELALAAGTLTAARLVELRDELARDHAALAARVRLLRDLDVATFTWARLCVGSRAFALSIDGVATTALVPLGDLLNHDPDPATRWTYDDAAAAFTLTATRAVPAGAEVTDSYGAKPSSQLAAQYGFALPDNPDDLAPLGGGAVGRRAGDAAALALWARLGLGARPAAEVGHALAAAVDAAAAALPASTVGADAAGPRARTLVIARESERAVIAAWRARLAPVR